MRRAGSAHEAAEDVLEELIADSDGEPAVVLQRALERHGHPPLTIASLGLAAVAIRTLAVIVGEDPRTVLGEITRSFDP